VVTLAAGEGVSVCHWEPVSSLEANTTDQYACSRAASTICCNHCCRCENSAVIWPCKQMWDSTRVLYAAVLFCGDLGEVSYM